MPCHNESPVQRKVVVIGAAGKKAGDYIRVLMQRPDIILVAVVINQNSSPLIQSLERIGTIVIRNAHIDVLIEKIVFDIAFVCVPHEAHFSITERLLNAGKYVIKEKPLAMTVAEMERYTDLIKLNMTLPIFTTVQRNTMPAYIQAKQELHRVGHIVNFQYDFWLDLKSVTTGWRSKMATARGGVILDMGYHAIDILLKFFDEINHINSSFVSYKYPETMQEDLEDYAEISIQCKKNAFSGTLRLDRHGQEKKDLLIIEGKNGTMSITPQGYQIFDMTGSPVNSVDCVVSKDEEIRAMLNQAIPQNIDDQELEARFCQNKQTVQAIADIYACKQMRLSGREAPHSQHWTALSVFQRHHQRSEQQDCAIKPHEIQKNEQLTLC